ncbi:hypothetical protein CDH04_09175 [Francisella adeliensis]|nr:hypothetical protein CDH04_09175 [Francisella adeliensis]MBK2086279.1 hypothetical protein [Francisella adeliensis]QIW14680.1 hypothetical protein FZC44_09180 [Francisella adeliensis]
MELQNLFYKDLSLTVNNDDKLDLILEMLKRIPPSKIKKISKLSAIFFKKNRVIISRNLLLKNSKRARKLNIRYWLLCILFMVIGVSLIILLKDVFRGDIPIGAVAYIVYIFCIGFLFEIIALQRAECILKMDEYKCIFKSFYDSETVKIVKEKI